MARATVWDAYKRESYEGFLAKRTIGGIVIELENGVRLFASNDRIIEVIGETVDNTNEEGEVNES